LARTLGLEVSVRGGGHNVAGRATIDGGLMIDLSPMKGVHVDVHARAVRAQGGVLWNELNRETQLHGLATTGGVVGTTGIAGLTLGGGLGWLMPKYGLALDNLRSAELVLADGSVLRVSADENPDLFWAIRGGGGNFGIAASLEYQLHEVGPMITGGVVVHPLPRALDALRFFRDQCDSLPDEAMLVAALQTAPDGSNAKIAAIVGATAARSSKVRRRFDRSRRSATVMDMIGPMPYATLNGMLDGAFPKGALNYWKAQFLTDLSDAAIRALIAGFEQCPSPMSHVIIEHFHGAAARVPLAATACTTRVTGFNVVIVSQWTDMRESERKHQMGPRDLCVTHAVSRGHALPQLPRRRCVQRRRGGLWPEPSTAEGDQDAVRPRQFLQAQRQHSSEVTLCSHFERHSSHDPSCRSYSVPCFSRGV
jgi:hypothetical protein